MVGSAPLARLADAHEVMGGSVDLDRRSEGLADGAQ